MRRNAVTLAGFEGSWRVEREIRDALGGGMGRFSGTARFTPMEGGLRYFEEGEMHLGQGAPMRATRVYLWRAMGGLIELRFEDGRAFHVFDPGERAPQASHWCDPDQYDVAYDFGGWPRWQARWKVRGPRKDYEMISRYEPL